MGEIKVFDKPVKNPTSKGIVVLAAVVIGYLLGSVFGSETVEVLVDNETKWCFYAEYGSAYDFEATVRPQTSFITTKGSKYYVFARCDTFDWYEKAI